MMRISQTVSRPLAMLTLIGLCSISVAQDDEESPYRPGLVANYSSGGISATRTDELLTFDWQDASPDPRLPAGEFTANWRGRLWTQTPGKYRLYCFAQGEV